jgi:hypothetical protein
MRCWRCCRTRTTLGFDRVMDRLVLNHALTDFFAAYRTARYQGVALTVPSQADLGLVQAQLAAVLLDCDLWTTPGRDGSPDIPCTRRAFNSCVLSLRSRTLVVAQVPEWMIDWSDEDRGAFWSALADLYGRHAVRTLDVETPDLGRHLRVGFQRYRLTATDVRIWLSRHQSTEGLQEVLQ